MFNFISLKYTPVNVGQVLEDWVLDVDLEISVWRW